MPLYTMVRADSDGKYTLVSRSARLRSAKATRSSSMPPIAGLVEATNNCSKVGMTSRAVEPIIELFVGTGRQPRTFNPSVSAIAAIAALTATTSVGSCGRYAVPAAYIPAAGSSKSTTARKNSSGTRNKMPAPSPLSGSAPVAPRCSRFTSAVRAFCTMS
ncbi:unannotated protein [freshwater metagenome]|uniref:Unannotated protein n=1 Tax=freshwater metagenome TaxID=449393 RepID=A0A6J6MK11_9ZZZZ